MGTVDAVCNFRSTELGTTAHRRARARVERQSGRGRQRRWQPQGLATMQGATPAARVPTKHTVAVASAHHVQNLGASARTQAAGR